MDGWMAQGVEATMAVATTRGNLVEMPDAGRCFHDFCEDVVGDQTSDLRLREACAAHSNASAGRPQAAVDADDDTAMPILKCRAR